MENKMIKVLLLSTNELIISEIEEVTAELGDPNCKLIKPYLISNQLIGGQTIVGDELTPWMKECTDQDTMMIYSDKILTLVDPNKKYLNLYQEILK